MTVYGIKPRLLGFHGRQSTPIDGAPTTTKTLVILCAQVGLVFHGRTIRLRGLCAQPKEMEIRSRGKFAPDYNVLCWLAYTNGRFLGSPAGTASLFLPISPFTALQSQTINIHILFDHHSISVIYLLLSVLYTPQPTPAYTSVHQQRWPTTTSEAGEEEVEAGEEAEAEEEEAEEGGEGMAMCIKPNHPALFRRHPASTS